MPVSSSDLDTMTSLMGRFTQLTVGFLLALFMPINIAMVDGGKEAILPICPARCECTNVRSRSGKLAELGTLLKLKCGSDTEKLSSLKELDFSRVSHKVTQLDLSENQITSVEKGTFINFTQLKRLDLSNNKLSVIDMAFDGLGKLERLKLNHNQLTSVKNGIFDGLSSLKQLDMSGNPWACNCELVWLLDWVHNKSIKLTPIPKCGSPAAVLGVPIKNLERSFKLNCKERSRVPTSLELQPSNRQIVFEGDSLLLQCKGPMVGNVQLMWTWENKSVDFVFKDVSIKTQYLEDQDIVESLLRINHLQSAHTGQWKCHLTSGQQKQVQAVAVTVISEHVLYCPFVVTSDSRGSYKWPKTVMGVIAEVLCEGEPIGGRRAYHTCTLDGDWSKLNTSACPYVSETTKILEQFSKMNLSLTKGTILESAKRLKNFTGDGKELQDKMDVIFVAKTIENYLSFLSQERELGSILVDVVSSLLNVPPAVMRSAQEESQACSRLIRAMEHIVESTPSLQVHGASIAAEEFRVKRDTFPGLTCTWYSHGGGVGRLFHCSNNNATALLGSKAKVIEASVQVPASLFYQLEVQGVQGTSLARQLTVVMYENAHLFPTGDPSEGVTSAVVGVKLVGIPPASLADPVYIVLRSPALHSASLPRPVWWDDNNGWSSQGCQLSYLVDGLRVFQCSRLGYFGLLQNTDHLQDISGSLFGLQFRYCHPAIYIGSVIGVTAFSASIITFIMCHSSIQMSKKTKHSLVNTWIALALLCFLFALGIYQTEDVKICQGIGLVLHYLTLSALLWMSVTASNMYKQVTKSTTSLDSADDELPPEHPVTPKPVLGLYLVGWGIGLIVCGISGAVNMRQYAGHSHCFLMPGPAISAVFAPAAILLVYLFVCFLLIRCAVRNLDTNRQLSEGTQVTENVDLDLLDSRNSNLAQERTSLHSTPTASSVLEDPEYSSLTQLKAHVIILVFYILMWTAGALATTTPLKDYLPYEEAIFSVIYAVLASCLGGFVLFFYCVARSDVRTEWYMGKCWCRHKQGRCCRTRSISDTIPALVPVPVANVVPLGGATIVSSRHSVNNSLSHHTDKSSKTSKSLTASKAAIELNHRTMKPEIPSEKTNVNLVLLHRQQYRSNNSMTAFTEPSGMSSAEMFYNPHQSTVARKFFRKQRRHLKQNNLGIRRRGDGGGGDTDSNRPKSVTDIKLDNCSLNSKRSNNNSNNSNRNSEENSVRDLPLERLVIGAEEVDVHCLNSDVKLESEELTITFQEDEAELAELAAEFLAIKNEVHQNRLKEMSSNTSLRVSPTESITEQTSLSRTNSCHVYPGYDIDLERFESANSHDDKRNSETTSEMCSFLCKDDYGFTNHDVDSDSLGRCGEESLMSLNPSESDCINISLTSVSRKRECSLYSTNSSHLNVSPVDSENEEYDGLMIDKQSNVLRLDNMTMVEDEYAAVVNKKETSV